MDPQTLPLGCKFKFEPEDHELLVYLECKCMGEPLPGEGFIMEVDLYRLPDPGLLFERTPEKVVYVFTKLKKVSKNGKRIDRSVTGNTTWKGVDGGKAIYNADSEGRCRVGEKKNFVLVNKMKMKLGYNMTEFSLDNVTLRNSRFNDYVVCKIKKKAKNLRSPKYGDVPEQDTRRSYVSTLAMEGEVMTSVSPLPIEVDVMAISEEGYQHDENANVVLSPSQKEEEEQQLYQVSESHQGMQMFFCWGSDMKSLGVLEDEVVEDLVDSRPCKKLKYDQASNHTVSAALSSTDFSAPSFEAMQLIGLPDKAESEVFSYSVDCCQENPDELQNCVESREGDQLISTPPTTSTLVPEQEGLDLQNDMLFRWPSTPNWMEEITEMINFDDSIPFPEQEFSWAKIPGDAEFGLY